jgi:hypothetical protein
MYRRSLHPTQGTVEPRRQYTSRCRNCHKQRAVRTSEQAFNEGGDLHVGRKVRIFADLHIGSKKQAYIEEGGNVSKRRHQQQRPYAEDLHVGRRKRTRRTAKDLHIGGELRTRFARKGVGGVLHRNRFVGGAPPSRNLPRHRNAAKLHNEVSQERDQQQRPREEKPEELRTETAPKAVPHQAATSPDTETQPSCTKGKQGEKPTTMPLHRRRIPTPKPQEGKF